MPLDILSAARADIVYPRLNVTVDSGASIDIRNLDDVNGATNDATSSVAATHTQDNVERQWDPATSGVTTVLNATVLNRRGWAFPVADMTPPDPDACNAFIKAQTVSVTLNVSLTWATNGLGVDPAAGTVSPTFRATLWRYKPSDDTGVNIANGAGTLADPWDISAVGDPKGTFKQVTINITVPAGGVEFQTDETMLLQVGLNTGTLPDPLADTTTYTFALQVDSNSTFVDFANNQGIRLACALSDSVIGKGTVTESGKSITMARSATGKGEVSVTKATIAAKSFDLVGKGTITETHPVQAFRTFNLVGKGSITGRIELPIDEVPTGEGGGEPIIIKKPIFIFDD